MAMGLLWGLLVAITLSSAHGGVTEATSDHERRSLPLGVTYTPNHNREYPTLGGWVDKTKLEAAIDADLAFLSKYFTHIRTVSATYYDCDVVAMATRHGLKWYFSPSSRRREVRAVVDAVRRYPHTVEAVIVGADELRYQVDHSRWANASDRFSFVVTRSSEIIDQVDEIKRKIGNTDVKFGTLDSFSWLQDINYPVINDERVETDPTPYRDQVMANLGKLDLIGVKWSYWTAEGFPGWSTFSVMLPQGKKVFIEGKTAIACHGQYQPPGGSVQMASVEDKVCIGQARERHDLFTAWVPPNVETSLLLWDSAFDEFFASKYSDDGKDHFFTWDRKRKFDGFPRPLQAGDDPAIFPTSPLNETCRMGMYHEALADVPGLLGLCTSGHSFRNPTKFDEFSIKSACDNPFCHAIIAKLREIPSPPPCPYNDLVTETMLREMILKPFDLYCGQKKVVLEGGDINLAACFESSGSASLSHFVYARVDDVEGLHCDNISNFTRPNVHNGLVPPLTQVALEQMCFKPECESMMLQMANPPFKLECFGQMKHVEELMISTVLLPFYDGCYEPSLYPVEYYDTTYRQRKKSPKLPSAADVPSESPPLPTYSRSPAPSSSIPLWSSSSSSSVADYPNDDQDDSIEKATGKTKTRPQPHTKRSRKSTTDKQDSSRGCQSSACQDTEVAADVSTRPTSHPRGTPKTLLSASISSPFPSTPLPDEMSDPAPARSSHEASSRNHFIMSIFAVTAIGGVVGIAAIWRYKRQARQSKGSEYVSMSPTETDSSHGARVGVAEPVPIKGSMPSGSQSVLSDPTLAGLFIRPHHIHDVRIIGSGGQGLVYLVEYKQGETDMNDSSAVERAVKVKKASRRRYFASKRFSKHHATNDPQIVVDFVAEIKLIASLKHPNIVQLVGTTWTTSHDIQALFEYMPDGDLYSHLSSTPQYEWNASKWQIAVDVIEALAYVHSLDPPLVHRDIKSRNVLLKKTTGDGTISENTRDAISFRAKLTDFGVSRHYSKQQTMTTGVGTSRWLAPEVILGGGDYDQSCDIYSFGVLLSELDTHELPFMDRCTPTGDVLPVFAIMEQVASEGILPRFSEECPSVLLTLAHECLSYNPRDRPSADGVRRRLFELKGQF